MSNFQDDLNRSIHSLIKSGGLFKSIKHYAFLDRNHREVFDPQGTVEWWNDLAADRGNSYFRLDGHVQFSEFGGRSIRPWTKYAFYDGQGITRVYKLKYYEIGHGGMAVKSASIVWEREDGVVGIDFKVLAEKEAAALEKRKADQALLRTDVTPGRYEMIGKIVKIAEQYHQYSSYSSVATTKATIINAEGNMVYGTLPDSVGYADVGDVVKFTAKFDPQDTGFAFYKRPSKATIITPTTSIRPRD